MLQGILSLDSLFRIQHQTFKHQVQQVVVLKSFSEFLMQVERRERNNHLINPVRGTPIHQKLVFKCHSLKLRGSSVESQVVESVYGHGLGEVFQGIAVEEEELRGDQLVDDAPDGPNIDCKVVSLSHDHFRGSVGLGLQVVEIIFVTKRSTTEVNHLHILVLQVEEEILRLDIAMKNALLLQKLKSGEDTPENLAHLLRTRPFFGLDEPLQQRLAQLLGNDEEMVVVVEELLHVEKVLLIWMARLLEVLEDVHLHERLVEILLVIFDFLHAEELLRLQLPYQKHMGECALSYFVHYFVLLSHQATGLLPNQADVEQVVDFEREFSRLGQLLLVEDLGIDLVLSSKTVGEVGINHLHYDGELGVGALEDNNGFVLEVGREEFGLGRALVLDRVSGEVLVEGLIIPSTSVVEDVLAGVHFFDPEQIEFPEIRIQMPSTRVFVEIPIIVGVEAVVFVAEEAALIVHLLVEVDFLFVEKLLFQVSIAHFL